tara:strand:+ start:4055 stop:4723 length:669 start_codon:yes stop_codon:yes gene_type:complete
MASAPQQQQTQQERDQIKLGQEQTQRARTKSAPLLADFQKKMNRDDSSRLGGMAAADVAQAAGTDRTGQQLASGQGGGFGSTGLGAQLSQATNNASNVALSRQDSMKSNYGELGNKKNMNSVAGLKAASGAASNIAAAEANASATKQNAMLSSATNLGSAYGLKSYDNFDGADYDYQKSRKALRGKGSPFEPDESEVIKSLKLRDKRNNMPGASLFNKLGSW